MKKLTPFEEQLNRKDFIEIDSYDRKTISEDIEKGNNQGAFRRINNTRIVWKLEAKKFDF